jgi:hypothetical protein
VLHQSTAKDGVLAVLTALGAVVSIFAKPMSRSSYTTGKLMAAVSLLLLIEVRFGPGASPIDRLPDASGAVDIWFWFDYVVAISVVLFWSVRRKQV